MKAVRIYDNGGDTIDRYTAVFLDEPVNDCCDDITAIEEDMRFTALGMSDNPFHPQGVGMHVEAVVGPHLGKRIKFEDLPEDCQKLITQSRKIDIDSAEQVDGLLRLADQSLEDWEKNEGKNCPEALYRRREWDAVRPLLVQATEMRRLLETSKAFIQEEAKLSGERVGYLQLAKDHIAEIENVLKKVKP